MEDRNYCCLFVLEIWRTLVIYLNLSHNEQDLGQGKRVDWGISDFVFR